MTKNLMAGFKYQHGHRGFFFSEVFRMNLKST